MKYRNGKGVVGKKKCGREYKINDFGKFQAIPQGNPGYTAGNFLPILSPFPLVVVGGGGVWGQVSSAARYVLLLVLLEIHGTLFTESITGKQTVVCPAG